MCWQAQFWIRKDFQNPYQGSIGQMNSQHTDYFSQTSESFAFFQPE